jgi:hypothetical protein
MNETFEQMVLRVARGVGFHSWNHHLRRLIKGIKEELEKGAEPYAWHCQWRDWAQYHDKGDPLPAEWDEAPRTITPLYTRPNLPPEEQCEAACVTFSLPEFSEQEELEMLRKAAGTDVWKQEAHRFRRELTAARDELAALRQTTQGEKE